MNKTVKVKLKNSSEQKEYIQWTAWEQILQVYSQHFIKWD